MIFEHKVYHINSISNKLFHIGIEDEGNDVTGEIRFLKVGE
jgi:hypothetical protein